MSPGTQELIAFGIVGLTAGGVLVSLLRSMLLPPLARELLRRGQVGRAMRLQALISKGSKGRPRSARTG